MKTLHIFKEANEVLIEFHNDNHQPWKKDEGIIINFTLSTHETGQRMLFGKLKEYRDEFKWLIIEDNYYYIDLGLLKTTHSEFNDINWLKGVIKAAPILDNDINTGAPTISFHILKEDIILNFPQKIFLSHKGIDKPVVREYHNLLKELGFKPWLDEDAMTAGEALHRALLKGMQDSCAAVFFVTPNYVDDGYLEQEIDYAISEKMNKRERFSIITLSLPNEQGKRGQISSMLKRYVWKTPDSHLEGFREIIRALPISSGVKTWRNEN
ncbi:toll/interleukin-1 receptor domain-containing protein [Bacillus safensis]|uniref:toll/interleukin-1 receptor domain-containing protein n=1 Tax=Bacillus safensis TaxID=561879 RepID=UPI00227E98B2|nr:toll/interleukin-1 receptor domain-containing protein [Bacillus safensis]MCY7674920.1 toll/interleukin-1 receptor domain-containing protein [Bacillus safensis]MCY7697273.1 toll/interleukin-1 receptor domain-containing protein [Bacillus safensis]MEC3628098.1 toll/interleukin-1 receptor domain-containing protein [Bacillus safensis]